MKNPRILHQSRQTLDARFNSMQPLARFHPPIRGWIKAIREALGMSSAQLAQRLQIKQPTLTALEKSELKETIQLATLRRVAEAMNCTLIYALVPNNSLETMVKQQAHKSAKRRLRSIEHSMLLENQSVPSNEFEERIDALARDMNPRALWDEK